MILIIVLMAIVGLVVFLGNSYAYMEKSVEGSNVNLEVGKLIHSLNSDVKLDKGESRIIDLIVKNNENILSKYQIYYTSDDDLTDVVVGYSSDSIDLPSGEIEAGGRKRVSLVLQNNSDSEVSVEVGVKSGLAQNTIEDIILETGEYRVNQVVDYIAESTSIGDTVMTTGLVGMYSYFSSSVPINYTNSFNYKYLKYTYNGNIGCSIIGDGTTLKSIAAKSGAWQTITGTLTVEGISSISVKITQSGATDGNIRFIFTNTP